jgi:hypothetical protein
MPVACLLQAGSQHAKSVSPKRRSREGLRPGDDLAPKEDGHLGTGVAKSNAELEAGRGRGRPS